MKMHEFAGLRLGFDLDWIVRVHYYYSIAKIFKDFDALFLVCIANLE